MSQQISKLERETRTVLFERRGRGVVLTDAARASAQQVLSRVEWAEVALEEQRGQVVGRLVVAAFATAVRGLLPGALADLALRYTELDVRLVETDPYLAAELVARGEVDLAVVLDWRGTPVPIPDTVSQESFGKDPLDLLLAVDHPLAALPVVTVTDLLGQGVPVRNVSPAANESDRPGQSRCDPSIEPGP